MDAQQLHDHIIKPTLEYMKGNYNSKNARFLLLCTAAVESNCGHKIKQVDGPALGIWQVEPLTHIDIWQNCDALFSVEFSRSIHSLEIMANVNLSELISSPLYSCAMARLKYSMDTAPLPDCDNFRSVYDYYKRIYNTPLGASTYEKFKKACIDNGVFAVDL